MPVLDFLNDASYQDHPFVVGSTLPKNWILDCDLVVGPRNNWVRADYTLESIVDLGADWEFTFASAGGVDFVFVVPKAAIFGSSYYVEVSSDQGMGFGMLQVGDLTTVAVATPGTVLIPTRVSNLSQHFVTEINVANQYTTLYQDEDCSISNAAPVDYAVEALNLTGDVQMRAGRFVVVNSVPARNQLTFGAAQSGEQGGIPPCETIRVLPEDYDSSPEPSCAELLYSINGQGPDPETHGMTMSGSRGVTVTATGPHELEVKFFPLVLLAPEVEGPICYDGSASGGGTSETSTNYMSVVVTDGGDLNGRYHAMRDDIGKYIYNNGSLSVVWKTSLDHVMRIRTLTKLIDVNLASIGNLGDFPDASIPANSVSAWNTAIKPTITVNGVEIV